MTTDTITTVYLITAVSTDDTPLGSTPREVLYGNSPRAYATLTEAVNVAVGWNRRAEADNWPWRYEVDPIQLSALADTVGDYIDAEPLAGRMCHGNN